MSQRSNVRLLVLGVLLVSLVMTLVGRLYYLQVVTGRAVQDRRGEQHRA
jgi:cell division protein FtsI/penicillin-binding protein 2